MIADEERFPYQVAFYTDEWEGPLYDQMHRWAVDNFGKPYGKNKSWEVRDGYFAFSDKSHRDWFLLKWS